MSQPLGQSLDAVAARIDGAPALLIALAYDGTLSPLADTPEQAELSAANRRLLRALARHANVAVAVISGRELGDLRAHIGLEEVIYIANHGLEIAGPGWSFVEPTAAASRDALKELTADLAGRLATVPGALVEDKGLTISVHDRLVPSELCEEVRQTVHGALARASHPFQLTVGDRVYEIRPRVYWNKGSAVALVKEKTGKADTLIVYVGDDATDEDAFTALANDITIKVGAAETSAAHYQVDSPAEVQRFLGWLAEHLG